MPEKTLLQSLFSFNLADAVACSVAAAALLHTLSRDWRAARAGKQARLTIEPEWDLDDDVILVRVLYNPADGHTRYRARVTVRKPKAGRLSKSAVKPYPPAAGGVPILRTAERRGLDPAAAKARSITDTMSRQKTGEFSTRLVLSGAKYRARLQVEVIDEATGRRAVRKSFSISV